MNKQSKEKGTHVKMTNETATQQHKLIPRNNKECLSIMNYDLNKKCVYVFIWHIPLILDPHHVCYQSVQDISHGCK